MKNLIITIAILLLMLTMLRYQQVYHLLITAGVEVDGAAEEAAASAALCLDWESYGEGIFRWNRKEAEEKAAERISQNLNTKEHQVRWEVFFNENQACPQLTVRLYAGRLQAVSTYEYAAMQ